MLEREYAVGELVSVPVLGFASVDVNGVITETKDYPNGAVYYKVDWEDGQYNDEWWDANELSPANPR